MKGRNGGEMTGRGRVWRAESALFAGLRHHEERTECVCGGGVTDELGVIKSISFRWETIHRKSRVVIRTEKKCWRLPEERTRRPLLSLAAGPR